MSPSCASPVFSQGPGVMGFRKMTSEHSPRVAFYVLVLIFVSVVC